MAGKGKKGKKKPVEEPECEGYGLAFDEDDAECDECDVKEECESKTVGEESEEEVESEGDEDLEIPEDEDEPEEEEETTGKKGGKKPAAKKGGSTGMEKRVKALESRMDELEEKVESGGGRSSGKATKAEKDAMKQELVDAGPYSKAELGELNGRQLKMLASGLGINSFGMGADDVTAAITKHYTKKKGGKKPGKKGKK